MADLLNQPLKRWDISELLGVAEREKNRKLAEKLAGGSVGTSRNDLRQKLAEREAIARQDMQLKREAEMADARNYQQRMGELMMGRTGLSGAGAHTMAQNEQMQAQAGKMGGAPVGMGGRSEGGGRSNYMSPEQEANVKRIMQETQIMKDQNKRAEDQAVSEAVIRNDREAERAQMIESGQVPREYNRVPGQMRGQQVPPGGQDGWQTDPATGEVINRQFEETPVAPVKPEKPITATEYKKQKEYDEAVDSIIEGIGKEEDDKDLSPEFLEESRRRVIKMRKLNISPWEIKEAVRAGKLEEKRKQQEALRLKQAKVEAKFPTMRVTPN